MKLFGECKSYNNCDDVWRFFLKKCEIKGENFDAKSSACRIIAMEAANRESEVRKEPAKKAKTGGGGGSYHGGRGGSRMKGNNGFKPRGGRR